MASARIKKEISQCMQPDSPVKVEMVGDNITHLKGSFKGPADTPYEGVFSKSILKVCFTTEYPFKPPKMKFITKVYHPKYVSFRLFVCGSICLDILKDQWSPVLTLKTALISLQSLMSDAAPDNPQDAQVARHYISDRAGFDDTARQWTKQYAGGNATEDPDYIDPSVDR
ncbi:ubiquitin conjugating enzyme, partial [Rhizoclosmatium globosum]